MNFLLVSAILLVAALIDQVGAASLHSHTGALHSSIWRTPVSLFKCHKLNVATCSTSKSCHWNYRKLKCQPNGYGTWHKYMKKKRDYCSTLRPKHCWKSKFCYPMLGWCKPRVFQNPAKLPGLMDGHVTAKAGAAIGGIAVGGIAGGAAYAKHVWDESILGKALDAKNFVEDLF